MKVFVQHYTDVPGGWPELHIVPWRIFATSETLASHGVEATYERRCREKPTAADVAELEERATHLFASTYERVVVATRPPAEPVSWLRRWWRFGFGIE